MQLCVYVSVLPEWIFNQIRKIMTLCEDEEMLVNVLYCVFFYILAVQVLDLKTFHVGN